MGSPSGSSDANLAPEDLEAARGRQHRLIVLGLVWVTLYTSAVIALQLGFRDVELLRSDLAGLAWLAGCGAIGLRTVRRIRAERPDLDGRFVRASNGRLVRADDFARQATRDRRSTWLVEFAAGVVVVGVFLALRGLERPPDWLTPIQWIAGIGAVLWYVRRRELRRNPPPTG